MPPHRATDATTSTHAGNAATPGMASATNPGERPCATKEYKEEQCRHDIHHPLHRWYKLCSIGHDVRRRCHEESKGQTGFLMDRLGSRALAAASVQGLQAPRHLLSRTPGPAVSGSGILPPRSLLHALLCIVPRFSHSFSFARSIPRHVDAFRPTLPVVVHVRGGNMRMPA